MKILYKVVFGFFLLLFFACGEQKPTENKNNNIPEQSNSEVSDKWSQYIDKKGANEKDKVEKSGYSDNQFVDLFPEQSDSDNEPRYIFEDETSPPNPDDIIWDDDIFEKTLKEAEQGDSGAQLKLARMYIKGEGTTKDSDKAVDWLQKAISQGNTDAQLLLGLIYFQGDGLPKNEDMGYTYIFYAAENGNAAAQEFIGTFYYGTGKNKDDKKAVEYLKKSAEQGNVHAQFSLGYRYDEGKGVSQDFGKAVEWYEKAAKHGNSNAQHNLALMYEDGKGVPQDFNKAVEWYQKAAIQGAAKAQNNLALRYFTGEGIPQDRVLAYAWANLSAVKENRPDKKLRDIIAGNITFTEIAEGQRLSSNWKPGMLLARENPSHTNTTPTPDKGNENAPIKYMTGTGFVISKEGHILTNNHVVEGCNEIKIAGTKGTIKLLASDAINDLALLQIDTKIDDYALLAPDTLKLKQGEDIIVFGYPLNSVLSSSGNLTPGTVSALTGIGNNTNQIQLTAPIQPGSSGSPVISKKGYIIGIVSMKLSDGYIANATGSIPQNVNFAVNLQTIKSFLDINKVPYETGSKIFSLSKNSTDIAEEAKKWTIIIENWK